MGSKQIIMKVIMKVIALVVWMIISLILTASIVGLSLFVPGTNNSPTYKPVSERRSTWCSIGYKLLENVIK